MAYSTINKPETVTLNKTKQSETNIAKHGPKHDVNFRFTNTPNRIY